MRTWVCIYRALIYIKINLFFYKMRNRIQLSCVECRRKKKKCDRLTPCERCIKDNKVCVYTKSTEKSLELSSQSEYIYREDDSSYYKINKNKRVDTKLFKLTYVLQRMVDFCHIDPKLNYIKVNIKVLIFFLLTNFSLF